MDGVFILATVAGLTVGLLTVPFEVLKTRMQLNNELTRGKHSGAIAIARRMIKTEGINTLSSGFMPLSIMNSLMFSFRLGSYNYAYQHHYTSTEDYEVIHSRAILWTGCTGMVSQLALNPFSLVKNRMQLQQNMDHTIKELTELRGMRRVLRNIYNNHGLSGFFIGSLACIPRGFISQTVQILSYYGSTDIMTRMDFFANRTSLDICMTAAISGGFLTCLIVSPFDLVLTRIQSQPRFYRGRGILYSGFFDCVHKVYAREGLLGFYKGMGMMYFRTGPSAAATIFFLDTFRPGYLSFFDNKFMRGFYLFPSIV